MAIASAAYAIVVLAAGDRRRVLNFVEYARVVDIAGLHRWAGRWLLVLAAACAAWAVLAMAFPVKAPIWLLLSIASVVAALCLLLRGAERYAGR